ncbi:MAG: DNA cytosine methyltransferase, partial [Microcoleus sp.]
MEAIQLSLFSNESELIPAKKQKKAKLGRYERIQRELEANDCDPYKIFIDIQSQSLPKSDYTFVDLFCGAGGMTQGLLQAGFRPVASVEINPIASATHTKNFPDCHHLCDDIKNLNPQKLL